MPSATRSRPRAPRAPRPAGSVSIRLTDATADRAAALAAAVGGLTTFNRILARAVELGLVEVERELAGAVQASRKRPGNGVARSESEAAI